MDLDTSPSEGELHRRLRGAASLLLLTSATGAFVLPLEGRDRHFVVAGGKLSDLKDLIRDLPEKADDIEP